MNSCWAVFHATLLKHENLDSTLSYTVANKLINSIISTIAIYKIVPKTYNPDSDMISSTIHDIYVVHFRAPTVDKYSIRLLYVEDFHAVQTYTVSSTGYGIIATPKFGEDSDDR